MSTRDNRFTPEAHRFGFEARQARDRETSAASECRPDESPYFRYEAADEQASEETSHGASGVADRNIARCDVGYVSASRMAVSLAAAHQNPQAHERGQAKRARAFPRRA
jgi:hypothetical protein